MTAASLARPFTWTLVCGGCGKRAGVLAGFAECPACGGLLTPEAAPAKGRRPSPAQWRRVVEARAASTAAVDKSGVWAWRELLPDVGEKNVVTLGEGRSPMIDVDVAGRRAWIKQCGQQPTGSFKDLGMTVLVSAAKAMQNKRGIRALACASTGDTSAALAAYGARAGIPVVVLLPRGKVSAAQLVQPLANGARVLELDGDFDACMRVVADVGKRPGIFLANSKNPLRLFGQMTVAFEIAQDLGFRAPDVVVVPSGNLGNVYAIHRGFTALVALGLVEKAPRLVAAQVAAADPLHRARLASGLARLEPMTAGDTLATAIRIGDPVSFPRARVALGESGGTTTSCSEDEVVAGMRALDRQGLFACPQTGAAVAGARQLVESGVIKKREVVVVVSTASGLKFSDSKARVEENTPVRVPARVEAVVEALGAER